eukprot:GHVO01032542.1.p1 GENE.GHVO01032542.1~~GHVO01032542.1.p1  ORF type:complete len:203 (+),score=5.38 GHVO01032542.1:93-611(+)
MQLRGGVIVIGTSSRLTARLQGQKCLSTEVMDSRRGGGGYKKKGRDPGACAEAHAIFKIRERVANEIREGTNDVIIVDPNGVANPLGLYCDIERSVVMQMNRDGTITTIKPCDNCATIELRQGITLKNLSAGAKPIVIPERVYIGVGDVVCVDVKGKATIVRARPFDTFNII